MITFERLGATVRMSVETGIEKVSTGILFFNWDAKTELAAELLLRHLRDRFFGIVSDRKANAYLRGVADGRGHRRLKRFFNGSLTRD